MQFKYIAKKEQRLVKRIERSREICFRVLLCVWTNVIWRLMEQTTTQSFLKRIHFFKRTRFYVWKDVHLFMNIIVNDKKWNSNILFFCPVLCTVGSRRSRKYRKEHIKSFSRCLHENSQYQSFKPFYDYSDDYTGCHRKKFALKFFDFGPFLIF